MQNNQLRVSLVQYNIVWEDKEKNLAYILDCISTLSESTDLIILPEMSFTAFSFNTDLAETMDGNLLAKVKQAAVEYKIAICGSFLCCQDGKYYNRAFFITPDESHFYDKRHLFRMGREGEVLTGGEEKKIIEYKGFNICLLVCYDLRFPVWSRNVNNEYDVLVYVANWPESRRAVWNTLLKARAIENMCYVCGVNRIGEDNKGLKHVGESVVLDQWGKEIAMIPEDKEGAITVTIGRNQLFKAREGFPVWKDADQFELNVIQHD